MLCTRGTCCRAPESVRAPALPNQLPPSPAASALLTASRSPGRPHAHVRPDPRDTMPSAASHLATSCQQCPFLPEFLESLHFHLWSLCLASCCIPVPCRLLHQPARRPLLLPPSLHVTILCNGSHMRPGCQDPARHSVLSCIDFVWYDLNACTRPIHSSEGLLKTFQGPVGMQQAQNSKHNKSSRGGVAGHARQAGCP